MRIVHISAECYPVAKAGGLGDVVGALPNYLNANSHQAMVIMPKYDIKWINEHLVTLVHSSRFIFGDQIKTYNVYKEANNTLGFELFFVDVPGLTDRKGIYMDPESGYPYWDEFERFTSFQIASVDWINSWYERPDIIHCHDHHTALIPFLIKHAYAYQNLRLIPSVLTIHNGQYHGNYDLGKAFFVPDHEPLNSGLFEWDKRLNMLASGIKCAWHISTVSPTYLDELKVTSRGLESLLNAESAKMSGILNGIDHKVWNPATDPMLVQKFSFKDYKKGKMLNKKWLCERFGLDVAKPLLTFIGRLAEEKGADLLPDLFYTLLSQRKDISVLILGTGDPTLEHRLAEMNNQLAGRFHAELKYDEALAHKIYAGADALFMPSRVEPCGLNQMYALRYGTIPIVRRVGGLNDTIIDFSLKGGTGVHFDEFNLQSALHAIQRFMMLYSQPTKVEELIKRDMKIDHSWQNSSVQYIKLYQRLLNQ